MATAMRPISSGSGTLSRRKKLLSPPKRLLGGLERALSPADGSLRGAECLLGAVEQRHLLVE